MIYHPIQQYLINIEGFSKLVASIMGNRFLGIEENENGQFILLTDDVTLAERDMIDALERPVKKIVKINNFISNPIDLYEPPVELDYVTGLKVKLHRKSIVVKGEIKAEEFYEDYVNNAFVNLIVKEETTFTRDALGFPLYKDVLVKWYCEDGTAHATNKIWRSYYNQLEQIKEGKVRRGNLVANLQMPCIGLISIALTGSPTPTTAVILEGRKFLADYSKEFTIYIEDSNKEIISCFSDANNSRYVTQANYPWIDFITPYGISIRQFMINELTI
jgi:hypothetical protein